MTAMLVGLRSHRQIAPFTLHRPASLAEAVALRAAHPSSAYMAGGLDLIDRLKFGETVDHVIHLGAIPGLAAISVQGDTLRIGAGVTHAALAASTAAPGLASLWCTVANPRVRHAGSVGGNIMAGRRDYDGLPAMLALGARAEIALPGGGVALADLASLRDPALLTALLVPAGPGRLLFADRSLRPILTVWLGLTVADGGVAEIRAGIGIAFPTAAGAAVAGGGIPWSALGSHAARIAATIAAALPEPVSDGVASGAYRRRMVAVLVRRLLVRAGAAG